MYYLAIVLLFVGVALLWQSSRQRKRGGLPGGKVIYSDMNTWGAIDEPLYDATLSLTGRPDYLIQQGQMIIPVEVKSTRVAEAPYDSHIFQLAAYCYLVEKNYNIRPTHGVLHYPNRTYKVEYTRQLEDSLVELVTEMRTKGHLRKINRSHQSERRCNRCGFRSMCDQRL